MGNGCMKTNQNMYFVCRKEAAKYNDLLNSRSATADALGVSESSLADYELGITKSVPVDRVVLMADLYNAPHLKTMYCKYECPIGKNMPVPTGETSLEQTAISLILKLDNKRVDEVKMKVLEIAKDGVVDSNEIVVLKELMEYLDSLASSIGELRLICQKAANR